MNKRIISFICVRLIIMSCVSSLCFYGHFSTDGITPNAIYWIPCFFQISILLGQTGIGIYIIDALLRQKKEAVFSLSCFTAHLPLQNMIPLLQIWVAPSTTEYPVWPLMCQVIFSILLLLSLLINKPSSLFRKSKYTPRILMAAFHINYTYLAFAIIGTVVVL